ncbi:hypothetical protein [Sphaerisporangium sp. TRM90804]|uniref:hypothetical protein n=1 Tax=Sphaerisporangium sp. TRM90804 TaxID=3031113 RepID=UPI00244AA8A9|nr:hypothetical protein [Sphaerisporangium sp. TRM90804]MDH2426358.1 hypothetical protein [Sphaerisporangium sp. TRM90804]
MAAIVVIHGISQQLRGGYTLRDRLLASLRDGMALAGGAPGVPGDADVEFAAYGSLFRPPAEMLAPVPYYDDRDLDDYEQELLLALWRRAAVVDPKVVSPDDEVLARPPRWALRALAALSRSRFLTRVAEHVFIGDLKQVRAYFHDPEIRTAAQGALEAKITEDTRVVVAHSLGSVVAYETLCAHPEWPVRTLVTLGSPLGVPNLIYHRLLPTPGAWPGPITAWTNIADTGDVVAMVEDLRPLFGDRIEQIRVHNGAHAHDLRPYLTERLTGRAILAGLR